MASNYRFVQVNEFTPNYKQGDGVWRSIGNVVGYESQAGGTAIQLKIENGDPGPLLYFLTPTMFRVRFNAKADYTSDNSYAVVDHGLALSVQVNDMGDKLMVDTGQIRVEISKRPYAVSVYRGNQLIHADTSSYNLVYIPTAPVIANFKAVPQNALYFGFGEKAGDQLAKNQFTMTFFNYDNFTYQGTNIPPDNVVPTNNQPGPLNPSEPLYNSMPILIENNINPVGPYAGAAYSYGLFFDNPAQSFINIETNDYSDMTGKYYFGALYGDLNYYFIAGHTTPDVLKEYAVLTGPSSMPPMYALGYQQGGYGYYSRTILEEVANAYRNAQIPIDGLHIDVDFQNNYRTFTSSDNKFPNPKQMFDNLHVMGFKCSTNITGIVTSNPLDENGKSVQDGGAEYPTRDNVIDIFTNPPTYRDPNLKPFLVNLRAEQPNCADQSDPQAKQCYPFIANENYGNNTGINPFKYPTPMFPSGQNQLGTYGYYADLGNPVVQKWWGEQYEYLLSIGLDMIWQDMTCPAIVPNFDNRSHAKTLPLDLMMYEFDGNTVPNAVIHNAFAINLVKATYEGLTALKEKMSPGDHNYNRRNFIIARGGYAGIHRYAGIWTGDSASSWDFLKINIPEVLNIGLSGLPISGCDIGGFANGSGSVGNPHPVKSGDRTVIEGGVTQYELFTRWMTAGAFLPWYRNHYDGYTKAFQEPYRYGEPVPTHCRKYIEIRYKLLQLFYDAMYENTQNGMPIARAMFLNDPTDPGVYQRPYIDRQFFVRHDLLVAPVIEPGATQWDVYLPSGSDWYAYMDNQAPLGPPTPGGTVQTWNTPLDIVPLYVRAGAIIPRRELEQYVGELPENPLTFNIYPGPDSTYQLYQDDGLSLDFQKKGAFRLTEISHTGIAGGQQIRVKRDPDHDNYNPPAKFYHIALLGTQSPQKVSAAGSILPNISSSALPTSSINAYAYNSDLKITFIKIFDNTPDITLEAIF